MSWSESETKLRPAVKAAFVQISQQGRICKAMCENMDGVTSDCSNKVEMNKGVASDFVSEPDRKEEYYAHLRLTCCH